MKGCIMKDQIIIKKLEVFANHGVFQEEQKLGQKFVVSAILYTDTRRAGKTDDLTASIDYGTVCRTITDFLTTHTYKLLERAAECLAEELLLHTPGLSSLRLEIEKPWAPLGLPLQNVSVAIERGWHTAYLGLGSNLGDKEGYLNEAIQALKNASSCHVEAVSDFLVTSPYGVTDQDDFVNACLKLRTLLSPRELLTELHRIEQNAGRERTLRWGPRTLDLDILFYDDLILGDPDLCIPHVDLANRDFVLRPLCQIAPYLRHPVTGKTVWEMQNTLTSGQTKPSP